MIAPPLSKRFNCTYTKREAQTYIEMEKKLMDTLKLDRSGIHKLGIKNLHNKIINEKLDLVII